MVLVGKEAGVNVRALSLIHATGMAVIVTVAPILLSTVYGAQLTRRQCQRKVVERGRRLASFSSIP